MHRTMRKAFTVSILLTTMYTAHLQAQLTALPDVKGREGQIWGKLIPEGYADLGFGTSKAAPWRAGSNENTTIEFSTDVLVNGQPLAAGKYGFFVAYDPNECTLIFSKNSTSWGSFFYDQNEDALRVKVAPVPMDKE